MCECPHRRRRRLRINKSPGTAHCRKRGNVRSMAPKARHGELPHHILRPARPGAQSQGFRASAGPVAAALAMSRSVANLSAMDDKPNKNEGEGSKSADKNYRDAASDFARRNDTVQAGLDAEREVEQRKDEFEKAEQAGRSHSKGELPNDVQGNDFEKT